MANQIVRAPTTLGIALMSVALVAVSSCSESGRPERTSSDDDNPLAHLPALRGDYFPFDSHAVGRPFHIYVRLPDTYQADESARYPVVYVLDGDSLFPILAASHLFLTIDEGLPEAIVVGIAYGSFDPSINRRGFDFTAPGDNVDPDRGGAPAFHDFLKNELAPEIENRYRADPARRVLFGQSRGGSMVLYSAFTEPDLFWGRIASNPAFDPGRELFFSPARRAGQEESGLVVTSGSRDRPDLRKAALEWFRVWEAAEDKPWALRTVTIEDGTHAADSSNSYRAGMLWLFNRAK
jgi:predicted alpha/beta superfamily hydrolase